MPNWLTDWLAPWSDVAAPISAFGAIITAVVAVATLAASARDSYERTRPLVVPYAKIGPSYIHGSTYLIVKNFGATAAHNVSVTFDPELPKLDVDGDNQPFRDTAAAGLQRRYSAPTPVLAAGQSLTNVWGNRAKEDREDAQRNGIINRQKNEGVEDPELPKRLTIPKAPKEFYVTVTYEDLAKLEWSNWRDWRRRWRRPKKFTETVYLRQSDYDWEMHETPSDGNPVLVRQAKAMEAIAREVWD